MVSAMAYQHNLPRRMRDHGEGSSMNGFSCNHECGESIVNCLRHRSTDMEDRFEVSGHLQEEQCQSNAKSDALVAVWNLLGAGRR
jgi:hypothetical protein